MHSGWKLDYNSFLIERVQSPRESFHEGTPSRGIHRVDCRRAGWIRLRSGPAQLVWRFQPLLERLLHSNCTYDCGESHWKKDGNCELSGGVFVFLGSG